MIVAPIARMLAVAVAALLLSSCERGLKIAIVGSPSEPDFLLSAIGGGPLGGPGPAIDNLKVADTQGGPVWAISRDPACTPTPSFRFGTVPAGWRERSPPQRLREGVTYVLTVSGCGSFGGRTFKLLRGQIVSSDGTGDEPVKSVEAIN